MMGNTSAWTLIVRALITNVNWEEILWKILVEILDNDVQVFFSKSCFLILLSNLIQAASFILS